MPTEVIDPLASGDEVDLGEDPYSLEASTDIRDITRLEIDVKEDPFQVSSIVQKIDKNQILLTPDFQRKEVWDETRRSRFIESILLNYPLPPLFFNQDRRGRYIVVDGLQRGSSVYRYTKNEFALAGLEKLHWLNGRRFFQLEPELQTRIEDRKLLCYVLKPSIPMSVVFDIFMRINTGGMPLNRQEIRHGLYQGPAMQLLKRLTVVPAFRDWIGKRLNPTRMGDEEAALRCVAFSRLDPFTAYRRDMDYFLEQALEQLNDGSIPIEKIEVEFARTFLTARAILGEDAFRISTGKTKGQINRAVMETIYRFLARREPATLVANTDRIVANYQRLLANVEYISAVRLSTGDRRKVEKRFELAERILGE